MRSGRRPVVGLAALALLLGSTAVAAADIAVIEARERVSGDRLEPADVVYSLAVLASAGWDPDHVERAIDEVEGIFGQCGPTVTAGSVYRLQAPPGFRELDEAMQARLLEQLPAARPIALLVDQTVDRDIAYSYLRSMPTESRGTAWVTRNSEPACLGPLLAHELGHILLDSTGHSADRGNLMFATCNVSNVAGSRPGTRLTDAQCQQLRSR